MKILIVSQYFWPEEFRINDCATELARRGHDVVVLTGIPNYPQGSYYPGYHWWYPRKERYGNVTVLRIPIVPRGQKQRWRMALNYLSYAILGSILAPLYCRGKFDVILVYEPSPITVGVPAILMKTIKHAPILFWVQDLWPESLTAAGSVESRFTLQLIRSLVRWIYRHSDRILVQSEGFTPNVIAHGIEQQKIIYFPNWAEDLYKPRELEPTAPERAQMPQGFRVMFAGNIGVAQDFPTIVRAAVALRHHPEIQWIIIGDGRMRAWVENKIWEQKLQDVMHLLGRHPVEAMPKLFALADVLLVTLKRDPIFSCTIPGKIQSYLACAKPIVASLDGEGARVIQESGAGIACPSEDPDALAAAILSMASLPEEERLAMGFRGRMYYQRCFDRTMLIDRLEQLMKGEQASSL